MSLEDVGFSALIASTRKPLSSEEIGLGIGVALAGGAAVVGAIILRRGYGGPRTEKEILEDARKAQASERNVHENENKFIHLRAPKNFNPYLDEILFSRADVNIPREESLLRHDKTDYPEYGKRKAWRLDLRRMSDVHSIDRGKEHLPEGAFQDYAGIEVVGDEENPPDVVRGFAYWVPDEDVMDFGIGSFVASDENSRNYGSGVDYWQRPSREAFTKTFAFAIPDDHVIERMREFAPSYVEVGSGTGYWAKVLEKAGIDVAPFDNADWDDYWQVMWKRPIGKFPDKIAPPSALLLVWPPGEHHYKTEEEPRMDLQALELLEASGGDKVVFIGDDEDATGSRAFKDALWERYDRKARYAIPQWNGIRDAAGFYRRKPSDEELEKREHLKLIGREKMDEYRKVLAAKKG